MSAGRAAISGDGLVEDFDSPGHDRLYLNFEIKKKR